MTNELKDKIVLITGASSGIGKQCAKLLGSLGAIVVLASRNEMKLQKINDELTESGIRAEYAVLNVSSFQEFKNVVNDVVRKYGRIDVLINNAGVMLLSEVYEQKIDEWNQMIDVNFKGVLHGSVSVLPIMRKQKEGTIINVVSTAAYRVMPNSAVYSATKFAVKAFSEGLRKEESNHGLRVCLVAPGPTKTNLLNSRKPNKIHQSLIGYVDKHGLDSKEVAKAIAYQLLAPKNISVDELIISPTYKM